MYDFVFVLFFVLYCIMFLGADIVGEGFLFYILRTLQSLSKQTRLKRMLFNGTRQYNATPKNKYPIPKKINTNKTIIHLELK